MKRLIPIDVLTSTSAEVLISRYGLRSELAQSIVKEGVSRREDIFRKRNIARNIRPEDIAQLIVEPEKTPDPVLEDGLEKVQVIENAAGASMQLHFYESGSQHYKVIDSFGEIISCERSNESSGPPFDPITVRLFGKSISDFFRLSKYDRVRLYSRLQGPSIESLISYYDKREIDKATSPEVRGVTALVLLLSVLRWRVRPNITSNSSGLQTMSTTTANTTSSPLSGGVVNPGNLPDPGTGQPQGQCGPSGSKVLEDLVPELTFGTCCAKHDACYSEGCTECDRAKCDDSFFLCMLHNGNSALAALYYMMVVAFGQASFTYCEPTGCRACSIMRGSLAAAGVAITGALAVLGAASQGDVTLALGAAALTALLVWLTTRITCITCTLAVEAETMLTEIFDNIIKEIKQAIKNCIKQFRHKHCGIFAFKCWKKKLLHLFRCFMKIALLTSVIPILIGLIAALALTRKLVCP